MKAVRRITSVLSASAYRKPSQRDTGPERITAAASASASRNVSAKPARLTASMAGRRRLRAASTAVATGISKRAIRIMRVLLTSQPPQAAHVHRFESLANAVNQDAQHHHRHQHVEEDSD